MTDDRHGEINDDVQLMRENSAFRMHPIDRSNCAPLLKRRLRSLPTHCVIISLRGGPDYDVLAERLRAVYSQREDA